MDLRNILKAAAGELVARATRHNMKSKYVYKKLLSELESSEEPIHDVTQIKGAGEKTRCFFKKYLMDHAKGATVMLQQIDSPGKMPSPPNGSLVIKRVRRLDRDLGPQADNKDAQAFVQQSIAYESASPARPRSDDEYIPGYRTGAYAILKVLGQEDGLRKDQVCFRGNQYSDVEFNTRMRYSAWSAMKTLIAKGLVFNEDRPTRYYVSEKGRATSLKLPDTKPSTKHVHEDVVLLIDSREMKNKKTRSFFQKELGSLGVTVETMNLEVGDFLWVKGGFVLNYIVERKRGSDFASSLVDGRLKEQMQRLKSSGIRNIFYVIEGLAKRHLLRIGHAFGLAALGKLKMEGVTVIETTGPGETVKVLHMIDCIVRKKDNYVTTSRTQQVTENAPSDVAEVQNDLSQLSLGDIRASSYESFVCKGTKNKDFDADAFFYRSLLCVKGVSSEKAKAIASTYKTVASFLAQSSETAFFYSLSSIEVDGKKLGALLASKICSLFGIAQTSAAEHRAQTPPTLG